MKYSTKKSDFFLTLQNTKYYCHIGNSNNYESTFPEEKARSYCVNKCQQF